MSLVLLAPSVDAPAPGGYDARHTVEVVRWKSYGGSRTVAVIRWKPSRETGGEEGNPARVPLPNSRQADTRPHVGHEQGSAGELAQPAEGDGQAGRRGEPVGRAELGGGAQRRRQRHDPVHGLG